jgi:membrane associated rhomboid family serine protease
MIPLRDNAPISRLPVATWALILLNCVIFLFELSLPDAALEQFFDKYAMIPDRLVQGENLLSPLTCMFLHGGWLHLIGNMWTLYLFGDNVEDRLGSKQFLAFYLLTGLAANLTHFVTQMDSPVPTLGASGAIAGVMGAYLMLFPRARVLTLVPIFVFIYFLELPAVVFLGLWFLTQVLSGVLAAGHNVAHEGVAWWAHIGGFAAGIAMLPAFWQIAPPVRHRPVERHWPELNEWEEDEERRIPW